MTLADNPVAGPRLLLAPRVASWTEIRLTRMDGTPWLWNVMAPQYQWRWLTERVVEELGCDYAEIDIREDDNLGDVLTVKGEDVGLLW